MEIAFVVGIGSVGWVLGFALTGSPRAREGDQAARQLIMGRRFQRLLIVVGRTGTIAGLLQLPAWRRFSDVLVMKLRGHGLALVREQACALVVLAAALAAAGLLALLHSLMGVLLVLAALACGMPIWHHSCLRKERHALSRQMPDVFRMLAMALGSGETLPQAIAYVGSHVTGAAGAAFARASLRLSCGSSIEEAIALLRQELDAPGMGLLTSALVISQRTGSPLKGLFEYSARLVERQGEFERMLSVKTAQVRLSARVVSILPVLLVVGLATFSPDFRGGLMTPVGVASVTVAALMDTCALLIIKQQMKGVLS